MSGRFSRCIVIANPGGTHADEALGRVRSLSKLFVPHGIEVVRLAPGDQARNERRLGALAPQLGEHTLLCIAGGDGTVNFVVNMVLRHPALAAARTTPVLPLWGGNANDLAHMLNGPPPAGTVQKIIEAGRVVAFHPLQCTLRSRGGERLRLACCYMSFGATALAARSLSDPAHPNRKRRHIFRLGRLLQEVGTVLTAMLRAPRFVIEEQGRVHRIYERIIVNGSRFAKVDRVPLRLTEEVFYQTTVEHKRLGSLLREASAITSRRAPARVRSTRVAFTARSPLYMQYDGEAERLARRTEVTVELAPEPLYVLSSRLGS